MSLYLYNLNNKEYAVNIIEEKGDKAVIKFISRTEKGKGRLPSIRKVSKKDLIPLISIP